MSHPPTEQQQYAIDLASSGESCVLQAVAGAGKTSTLRMIAERNPDRKFQFTAFNKAIVNDVKGAFPANVAANTAHSLAFRTAGVKYKHRLGGGRMKPMDMARALGVEAFDCVVEGQAKRLAAGFCAGLVKKTITRFCQTADPEPTTVHVPFVPGLDAPKIGPDGKARNQRGPNHVALTRHLERAIQIYWADVLNVNGRLPFEHACYLKIFELNNPRIHADAILIDEAQDMSPVMLSIIEQQKDVQRIWVGDSAQSIYAWTGAVDALERADPDAPRAWLTQSFRFGEDIAEVANEILAGLDTDMTVTGAGPDGLVGPIDEADAYLYRTNAAAVRHVLREIQEGGRVALVGGADDVIKFAESAEHLMEGRKAFHPELACFDSWGEVQDYVKSDPNGSDLRLLVSLVDEFGCDTIIGELKRASTEQYADSIVSTAHKSKGREWPRVAVGSDFPDGEDIGDEERRLMYVAVTRAQTALDIDQVGLLNPELDHAV